MYENQIAATESGIFLVMKFTATLFSFIVFNVIAHPGFSQVSFSTDYGMYENQIAATESGIFLQRDVMIHSTVDFNFKANLFSLPGPPLRVTRLSEDSSFNA